MFHWEGRLSRDAIAAWVAAAPWKVTSEILEIWSLFGGGDMFESETILAPYLNSDDDIDMENRYLHENGLSPDVFAFHYGCCVSAVDQESLELVTLDRSTLKEGSRFDSLEEWYLSVIRSEFGDRYGLDPVECGD